MEEDVKAALAFISRLTRNHKISVVVDLHGRSVHEVKHKVETEFKRRSDGKLDLLFGETQTSHHTELVGYVNGESDKELITELLKKASVCKKAD